MAAQRPQEALADGEHGCTCATTSLAGTRRPSGTWTRCGCWSRRAIPTWRGGAAGPRASGFSASTASWTCASSTLTLTCLTMPSRSTWTPGCSGRRRPTSSVVLDVSAAAPVGHGVLSGRVGGRPGWRLALRVTLRTPDTSRVRRLALRLGDDGRIVSPATLVTEVREAATAALANYVVLSPHTRGLPAETASRHGRRVDSGPRKTSPALKRTDMFSDLFDSPWKILIVAVVLIVLFGSKKLPHAARSLGQSMRILKKEVQGLHEEESGPTAQARAPRPQLPVHAAGTDARPGRGSRRPAGPDRRAAAANS